MRPLVLAVFALLPGCNLARPADLPPFDASTCSPGVATSCDGDTVHRCNATGTGEESVQCTLGCDVSIAGGCRLCMPSETACTDGTVATCDAAGNISSMRACPLGCFQDQPRCTDVDPSNGLATYLDMTTSIGVDLDLKDGAIIDTATGKITDGDGTPLTVPSSLVAAPPSGVPVRVFIVKSAHLRGLSFAHSVYVSPAFAVVADGPVTVDGILDLTAPYPYLAPGSLATGPCSGVDGMIDNSSRYVAGSGGSGYATAGAKGGTIDPTTYTGGAAGQAFANAALVPLRGGCGSVASGGGGMQLVSREQIALTANAVINAGGGGGSALQDYVGGGGSGGGVLLEAPLLMIGTAAGIAANGGGGGSNGVDGAQSGAVSTAPATGGTCPSGSNVCGVGGQGAAATGTATNGGDVQYNNSPTIYQYAGGGGGGLGYIRINTADGTYTKASDAVESPPPSTAKVRTR